MEIKNFSLKFIDIMIGIVLGLGFQWWPSLHLPWQYIAFVFVYIDIIDYWIDYSPGLKKFPPKKEYDLMLDILIMFSLFLYIYATQTVLAYLLIAFVLLRFLDFFWLVRANYHYRPTNSDKVFVDTWMKTDAVEVFVGIILALLSLVYSNPLVILIIFILFRIAARIFASYKYKKINFA